MLISFLAVTVLLLSYGTAEGSVNVDRLESRLDLLGEKFKDLEQEVAKQNDEITSQKQLLAEKSNEINALRELLHSQKKIIDVDAQDIGFILHKRPDKRFVLDDSVAFFARLDKTELTGVAMNQTILFDNVVLNAGNSFDIKTGVFTVPVDGFYLLSVSVTSDLGHNHQLQVALMRNNGEIARAHAHGDSGHLDQGGVTVVNGLSAGDKISIKSSYPDITDFYGNGLTTFSGFQIMFK